MICSSQEKDFATIVGPSDRKLFNSIFLCAEPYASGPVVSTARHCNAPLERCLNSLIVGAHRKCERIEGRVPLPLGEGGAKRRVRVASLFESRDPHPTLSQRERMDLPQL